MIKVSYSQEMLAVLQAIRIRPDEYKINEDSIELNLVPQQLYYIMNAEDGHYYSRFKGVKAWNDLLAVFKIPENYLDNNA